MGTRSRYWCFTENVEPDALAYTLQAEDLPVGITYICGQIEKGEHLHLQGYVELDAHQRVSFLKKVLSPTAHFEPRYGTQEEAIDYTRKVDGTTYGVVGTGAIGDIKTGALLLVTVGDVAAGTADANAVLGFRVRFYDP